MRDLDNHFGAYNHLANLPRANEALFALRKAASCVKPMMRKRGWRVGTLSEFYPAQSNLLGLNTNRGETIQVRLRYPGDVNQFMPFNDVLDTLLHELSHIVFGPHDEKFNRLWQELRDEWEVLQIKGFSGEGFLGKGNQLGGNRIPVSEVQRRARAAAQERARLSKQKHDPGRRLGGGSSNEPTRPSRRRLRDMLAGAAMSRNKADTAKVDQGCGQGTQAATNAADDAMRNGFRTKAEMDDANSIAVAKALQELYELEEDDRIYDGLSAGPAPNGLTWDPEKGLQALEPLSGPSSRGASPVPRPNGYAQGPKKPAYPHPVTTAPGSRSFQQPRQDWNAHGVPVSRLVREAEAKQQKRRRQDAAPVDPTLSFENWPTSESGATFGGPPHRDSMAERPMSAGSDGAGGSWGCPQCTFSNNGFMDKCEICDAPRPQTQRRESISSRMAPPHVSGSVMRAQQAAAYNAASRPLGWNCRCGAFMENQWWTCSACGRMKDSS